MGVSIAVAAVSMPGFFIGASGVLIRDDLGFTTAGIGLLVSSFFAAGGLFSPLGGRLSEILGARTAIQVACGVTAVSMLAIAVGARGLGSLMAMLAVAGTATGLAQPAGNLALARSQVHPAALRFGIKQAAVPIAILLAGASVPLVGLRVGWRWAFGIGALLPGLAAMLMPQFAGSQRRGHGSRRRMRTGDAALAPLIVLAVAAGIGTGAAGAMPAYLVAWSVERDMDPGTAGWLLVAGSLASVTSRLLAGWSADRRRGSALWMLVGMLAGGSAAFVLLSLGTLTMLVLGTLLGFFLGWGWPGLYNFAVVRLNPNAPGAASGIAQAGLSTGAAGGPLLFGLVAERFGFVVAWRGGAVAVVVAAALAVCARCWLLRDRDQRTPERPDVGRGGHCKAG
ncbi:MAG: MFS transporter [Dehalococcoidia bacterium]